MIERGAAARILNQSPPIFVKIFHDAGYYRFEDCVLCGGVLSPFEERSLYDRARAGEPFVVQTYSQHFLQLSIEKAPLSRLRLLCDFGDYLLNELIANKQYRLLATYFDVFRDEDDDYDDDEADADEISRATSINEATALLAGAPYSCTIYCGGAGTPQQERELYEAACQQEVVAINRARTATIMPVLRAFEDDLAQFRELAMREHIYACKEWVAEYVWPKQRLDLLNIKITALFRGGTYVALRS